MCLQASVLIIHWHCFQVSYARAQLAKDINLHQKGPSVKSPGYANYRVKRLVIHYRRGSRINTDRFPKRAQKAQAFSGVRGLAPPRNYLDFYFLKSPFLAFRVIQMGYWPDFNLESVFSFKNIFNMKNVTYFRKTVETGVDPHLHYNIRATLCESFCDVITRVR